MPFSQLGLSAPISQALESLAYTQATPIQEKAIPAALEGRDLIGAAQTGTGKTAAFALPILEKLQALEPARPKYIRALVLSPTRELAIQIGKNFGEYGQNLSLRCATAYGGVDTEPQKQELIEGVDILIATPGRLLDLSNQKAVRFDELEILVLDEADKMLNMGFISDIERIIERLPQRRQNLMFSATLSNTIRELALSFMDEPLELKTSPRNNAASAIEQWLITVDKDIKSALLSHLILERQWPQALIFIRTKHGAAKLVSQLQKRGIEADCIHGDRSQAMREQVLEAFKSGEFKYLVATDIAARGLDIEQLPHVINYDLPFISDDYIHRIGRTGRAGQSGEAISLVSRDDFKHLCAIEGRLNQLIERREIEGFVARKEVPISVLNFVSKNRSPDRKQPEANSRPERSNKGRHSDKPAAEFARKPQQQSNNPWASARLKKDK